MGWAACPAAEPGPQAPGSVASPGEGSSKATEPAGPQLRGGGGRLCPLGAVLRPSFSLPVGTPGQHLAAVKVDWLAKRQQGCLGLATALGAGPRVSAYALPEERERGGVSLGTLE